MQEKSKNIFENSTEGTIGARIKVLIEKTGKSVTELESAGKIGNGTLKSWKEKSIEFSSNVLESFKRNLKIQENWWKTGEGQPILTSDQKPGDNSINEIEPVLRDLIEKNDRYRIVPTIILDKYEILSNRELESRERLLETMLSQAQEISATKQVLIDAKDKLIATLEDEIKELEEKLRMALTPQKA